MNNNRRIDAVRSAIEKCNIPPRDLFDIPTSLKTFPDGANYRMEVSGINEINQMEALIDEMQKRKVPIHRVIALGGGANLKTNSELRDLAQMSQESEIEVIVVPGPRQDRDIGSHVRSEWGRFSGVRPRGSEELSYLIADIFRALEVGIRGFILYGEDVLFLVNELKKNGDLPDDIVIKMSYTAGHANAAGAKLLENLGVDSFNPVTDLTLPMLSSIRRATDLPLDIVVVSYEALSSINRFWETPEIIRVSSPCYLKQELSGSCDAAREKVKYCQIMNEIVEFVNPDLICSKQGPSDLKLSKVKSLKGVGEI